MGAGDLTLLDLKNILEWHQLVPDKKYSSEEQHIRTKIKIQGFIVAMEDSSEPLVDDLIGTIIYRLDSASYADLQFARSLLANKICRMDDGIKSLSTLMNTVDEKIGETKQ